MSNVGWLFFDRIARGVVGVTVGAWVARYLGPSGYGTIAYAIAYVSLFQAVANLGADAIVVRDIARTPADAGRILGTVFVARAAAGLACWVAAAGGALLHSDAPALVTSIIAASLLFQSADSVDLWFQSQNASRRTVCAKLAAYLAAALVKVALVYVEAGLAAFAVAFAIDGAFAACGLFIAYRRQPASGRWAFSWPRAVQLLRESWPFMVSGVSVLVYMRIDQMLIRAMIDDGALGLYSAALTVSQIWYVVPTVFAVSLMPHVSRVRQHNKVGYERMLVWTFRCAFGGGLAVAVLVSASAQWVVRALYGEAFSGAAAVLRVHAFTNVFVWLGVVNGLWIVNEGRSRIRMAGALLSAVVCAALNWILMPRLGVVGAAYSAVVTQCVSAVVANAILARESFWLQVEALTGLRRSG